MLQTGNYSLNVREISTYNISYGTTRILIFVIYTGLCLTINIFGVITNVINIVCFVKQGFNEPINVSLLGLATSDTCLLITLVWTSIIFTLVFSDTELPFDAMGVSYLVAGHPHLSFNRVTSWITALITLERCLCIVAPLKVKEIVTSRRVCIITVSLFIILIFSAAPAYVVNRLEVIFVPEKNISIFSLVSTKDREYVEKISFTLNNFVIPFSACFVIIICTTILIISLSKESKWRKTSMKSDDVSIRNQRVAKMVTMISILFVVCFIPVMVITLSLAFIPDFRFGGSIINTSLVACGVGLVIESINSSSNIFIYYHVSSRYRMTFQSMFKKIIIMEKVDIKQITKHVT